MLAGDLQVGEAVQTLDGRTARTAKVAAVRTVAGAATMWDLTLSDVHTFAVGAIQAVVHNTGSYCDVGLNDPSSEISQVSMKARYDEGIDPGRNVAVYRIGSGDDAQYLAAANVGNRHSEEILNAFIDDPANGLSRSDVTGIYSERVPCMSPKHTCMDSMGTYPNAANDISFSLNPDIGNVRQQNWGKIAAAIADAVDAGSPAGLPGYQWIPAP